MQEYEEVTHRFELAGGYNLEHRIEEVLQGLGFKEEQYTQTLEHHERRPKNPRRAGSRPSRRPRFAPPRRADQPPRHMPRSSGWRDSSSSGAAPCLAIAHDRRFLNKVTKRTLDMEFTSPKTFTWYLQERRPSQRRRAASLLPPSGLPRSLR